MRRFLQNAVWLACSVGAVQAADLRDAWLAARQQHPDIAAASAVRAAGEARRVQADRLWSPTVALQAGAGAMGSRTSAQGAAFTLPGSPRTTGVGFETSVDSGHGARLGLELRKPLISRGRSLQGEQLQASADLADTQASAMEQALMLQTAQRYFDAVLAQQQHALLRAQQAAADRALSEAQDRFRLGDVPRTDVREAQARALANTAQLQSAAVDMQVARQALAQTTGWHPDQLPPLHLPVVPGSELGHLAPLPHWLDLASRDNLQLRALSQSVALAEREAAKAAPLAAAKLDLVAQAGADHLTGSGRWGSASNSARQYAVGVQLQVPLYTGGQMDARQQEMLRLRDKAQAELDSARLSVAQQVLAAWLQLQAGAGRLKALESARDAARNRLEATELGRQVGDRTTQELLHAQNDAMQAQSALLVFQARTALDRLTLLALAHQLDEPALRQATDPLRFLAPPSP